MALPSQKLDIPLTGGIDEKTRPELVGPGSLLTAQNLRQVKSGSWQKAPGSINLSTATLSGGTVQGKRLLSYKDELIQTDGINLFTDSATLSTWTQVAGLSPQLAITSQPTMGLQYNVQGYDCVAVNGYYVVAACLPNTTANAPTYTGFATVIDAATGAAVAAPAAIFGTGSAVPAPPFRLVTAGNVAFVLYSVSASIFVSWLDLTSATTINNGWQIVGAALATDTDGTANPVFDACSLGANFVVAYSNAFVGLANNTVTLRMFNSALVQQAASSNTNTSPGGGFLAVKCLSVSGGVGDVVFLAYPYGQTTAIRIEGRSPVNLLSTAAFANVVTVGGATTTRIAMQYTGTGAGILVATDGNANMGMYTRAFSVSGGAVVATGSAYLGNFRLNLDSRPFVCNGRVYCTVRPYTQNSAASTPSQSSNDLILVDLTQSMADRFGGINQGYLRVAGSIAPRLNFPIVGNDTTPGFYPVAYPTSVMVVSSTKAVMCTATLRSASSASLDMVTLDWGATTVAQPCALNQSLILGGSPPSFYDGVRCAELGFMSRPVITATAFSGIGTSPATGYKYIVVYEQIDARGQWHQSNVSDPSNVIKPVNQGVVVTATSLQCTNRVNVNNTGLPGPDIVRLALYRTKDAGTVYFRVSSDFGGIHATVMNNPSAGTVAFPVESLADANLGAPMYTQPGISGVAQVKVAPPSFSAIIAHNDRLVGCNGKVVWFSGQSVDGEGAWFADLFQFPVVGGGDVTALASMDGSLIIFKRNAIFYVDGLGPPDNGIGSDFSTPQPIATDVGCIDQRSVVVTPNGVMFQSLRGLEILTRGRQVAEYAGRPVEAELAAFPVVTSAVLHEASGHVLFALTTANGSSGTNVEWDSVHHLWTTHNRIATGVINKSATMVGNNAGTVPVYTWMNAAGVVYQEVTSSYLDAGQYISGTLETPWIHLAGLNGFQRVRKVLVQFAANTPSDVTLSFAFDYSASYTETATFTAATIAGWSFPQFVVEVGRQKCQAIRIKIVDTTPTGLAIGTGQGPTIIGLTLAIAVKPTTARMPIAQGS